LFLRGFLPDQAVGELEGEGEGLPAKLAAGDGERRAIVAQDASSANLGNTRHLREENRELREMLVNTMLEAASLRRRLGGSETIKSNAS
jgi:hypothetical protein